MKSQSVELVDRAFDELAQLLDPMVAELEYVASERANLIPLNECALEQSCLRARPQV